MDAQITVATGGRIGLRTNTTSSTDDILMMGQVKISNSQSNMILRAYYETPQIFPYLNNSGLVGLSNQAFSNMYSYGFTNLSDKRQKENIRDIDDALGIVLKLKGVKYDIKKEFAYDEKAIRDSLKETKLEKDRKNKIGFLAQDVNEILPEVVVYDDSTDIYGIDYSKVVPVLVEAIKELSAEIEELRNSSNTKSGSIDNNKIIEKAQLNQNMPNPFSTNTRIELYVPNSVSLATLYVYNLQGEQLKQITIYERENSSVTIEGRTLKPGMYLYTLIADGKEVDTKKMILTK
jgi:hypothetical protein